MIDESNAQQRRRDIRLELESLDPNDEIVREVLKKLRTRRRQAAKLSASSNGLYPKLQDPSILKHATFEELHRRKIELVNNWSKLETTEACDESKISEESTLEPQQEGSRADPSRMSWINRNEIALDQPAETYRIEIQSDAIVPGEIVLDKEGDHVDGRKFIERYEMVPMLHRKFVDKESFVNAVDTPNTGISDASHSSGVSLQTRVPDHLKHIFGNIGAPLGIPLQIKEKSKDQTIKFKFFHDSFEFRVNVGSRNVDPQTEVVDFCGVDPGIPRTIFLKNNVNVKEYLASRVEFAEELMPMKAKSQRTEEVQGRDEKTPSDHIVRDRKVYSSNNRELCQSSLASAGKQNASDLQSKRNLGNVLHRLADDLVCFNDDVRQVVSNLPNCLPANSLVTEEQTVEISEEAQSDKFLESSARMDVVHPSYNGANNEQCFKRKNASRSSSSYVDSAKRQRHGFLRSIFRKRVIQRNKLRLLKRAVVARWAPKQRTTPAVEGNNETELEVLGEDELEIVSIARTINRVILESLEPIMPTSEPSDHIATRDSRRSDLWSSLLLEGTNLCLGDPSDGDLNPIYPGERKEALYNDDDSSEDLSVATADVDDVMETFDDVASEILPTDADIEDIWLAKAVLSRIAEAQETSVDELIEDLCDKLDELDAFFFPQLRRKRWMERAFPKLRR